MDLQQIKELALLMQQTGLTSLHLTEGAVNIQMERAGSCKTAGKPKTTARGTQGAFPDGGCFLLCAFSAV